MAQDEKKTPPAPGQTITITTEALKQLIAQGIAEKFGRPFDEQLDEEMDRVRGKGRPLAPEDLVQCRSPLTGATFTARLIISREFSSGRIVELLDYVRPEGTDRHVDDGGLFTGLRDGLDPVPPSGQLSRAQYLYREWLYKAYFATDWNTLSGKPGSFLAQWRVPAQAPKAAE